MQQLRREQEANSYDVVVPQETNPDSQNLGKHSSPSSCSTVRLDS